MRRPVEEMIAEGLREVGILVLVFAILDRLVSGKITIAWTVTTIFVSAWLFGLGLYLERTRSNE